MPSHGLTLGDAVDKAGNIIRKGWSLIDFNSFNSPNPEMGVNFPYKKEVPTLPPITTGRLPISSIMQPEILPISKTSTEPTEATEAELFKRYGREIIKGDFNRVSQNRLEYQKKVADVEAEILRVTQKGKRLGKSFNEIADAIKRSAIRGRWDKIIEPKEGLGFANVSDLFKEPPYHDTSIKLPPTIKDVLEFYAGKSISLTEEEAKDIALERHGKARTSPSYNDFFKRGE